MQKGDNTSGRGQEKQKLPELSPGMRVEVLNPENRLIFVGKLAGVSAGQLRIEDEAGQNVPWVEYNTEVKLRGFQRSKIPFSLLGQVCGSNDKFFCAGLRGTALFVQTGGTNDTLVADNTQVSGFQMATAS